jgi:visual system homeobox protein 2
MMNVDSIQRNSETIHVTAPGAVSGSGSNIMPQRTSFAIQELLGLGDSSRPSDSSDPVTPPAYTRLAQHPFNASDHHQMMAASRMAYFNAHAAVAAAFMPRHNMVGSAGGHLGFNPQTAGKRHFANKKQHILL